MTLLFKYAKLLLLDRCMTSVLHSEHTVELLHVRGDAEAALVDADLEEDCQHTSMVQDYFAEKFLNECDDQL